MSSIVKPATINGKETRMTKTKTATTKATKTKETKETEMTKLTAPTYQFKPDAKDAVKAPVIAQVDVVTKHLAAFNRGKAHKFTHFSDPLAKNGKSRDFSAEDCKVLAVMTWLAKSDETRYATAAQLRDFGAKTKDGRSLEDLYKNDKAAWRDWTGRTPHVVLPMVYNDGKVHAWHVYYSLANVEIDLTDGPVKTAAAKARAPKKAAKSKATKKTKQTKGAAIDLTDPDMAAKFEMFCKFMAMTK